MKKILKQHLLDELKTDTLELLEEAQNQYGKLSAEQLLKPMPGGGWSIAQVMEHLNSYGKYYLPQVEATLEKAGVKKAAPTVYFTSGWLGNWFTNMMQPGSPGKPAKKMKAPAAHSPGADLPALEVREEFFRQQRRLLYLLDKSADTDLGRWRIPISIAPFIRLKLGDVFRFLVAHHLRHGKQMRRVFNHLHTDRATHREDPLPRFSPSYQQK